jgi:hypothetical protein
MCVDDLVTSPAHRLSGLGGPAAFSACIVFENDGEQQRDSGTL